MPRLRYQGNRLSWDRTRALILREGALIVRLGKTADFTQEEADELSLLRILVPSTDSPEAPAVDTEVRIVKMLGEPQPGDGMVYEASIGMWIPTPGGPGSPGPPGPPGPPAEPSQARLIDMVQRLEDFAFTTANANVLTAGGPGSANPVMQVTIPPTDQTYWIDAYVPILVNSTANRFTALELVETTAGADATPDAFTSAPNATANNGSVGWLHRPYPPTTIQRTFKLLALQDGTGSTATLSTGFGLSPITLEAYTRS